jgi:hypothetical protein
LSPAALALVPPEEREPLREPLWEQLGFPETFLGPRAKRRRRRTREEMAAHRAALEERRLRRRQRDARMHRLRGRQQRFRWPRKCSSLPRARSIAARPLSRQERREAEVLAFLEPGWDAARPRTRADCADHPRPCPWVSCRYNLYLDVSDSGRTIKLNFPELEPGAMPAGGSCVLDIADRVAQGEAICLEDIGRVMNLSIERVRQLSSLALQGARIKSMWEEQLVKVRLPGGRQAP